MLVVVTASCMPDILSVEEEGEFDSVEQGNGTKMLITEIWFVSEFKMTAGRYQILSGHRKILH